MHSCTAFAINCGMDVVTFEVCKVFITGPSTYYASRINFSVPKLKELGAHSESRLSLPLNDVFHLLVYSLLLVFGTG